MITFTAEIQRLFSAGLIITPFLVFFIFVWVTWGVKTVRAKRYQALPPLPVDRMPTTSVIVPVYNESHEVFTKVLSQIQLNGPTELVVVVDGSDPDLVELAGRFTDKVVAIPKSGKRRGIQAGLAACRNDTEVFLVVDSDTIWADDMLANLLSPFADPRVGGVTPIQRIFDRERNSVRRLADWIEDLRYHGSVPAQSITGEIGCLAGRTIAYRREAFVPAVEELINQRVFGLPMEIGDDRVLTNSLLRAGWKSVYQLTAECETDAPNTWRVFWRQQLRWGRSSQRETFLSLGWLWKRPFTFFCFMTDILIPFALYGLFVLAIARFFMDSGDPAIGIGLGWQIMLAYIGMLLSLGVRQIPHFRRYPGDLKHFPVFVLQLTFIMAPIRIAAFATMFHQNWSTRTAVGGGTDGADPEPAFQAA